MTNKLLVLDASAMINVLGCGSPHIVLGAFKGACVIEENTLKEIIRDPFSNKPAQPELDRLLNQGSLTVQRMSEAAYKNYLDLVSPEPTNALGRGESAALAHANDVGGLVVLDDLKARRIGKAKFGACEQWTSVGMFRVASELLGLSKKETSVLVSLAGERARMHILENDLAWVEALPDITSNQAVRMT